MLFRVRKWDDGQLKFVYVTADLSQRPLCPLAFVGIILGRLHRSFKAA